MGKEYQYHKDDRAAAIRRRRELVRKAEMMRTAYEEEEAKKIQTKLEINQPGDKHEQEADAVAKAVVSDSRSHSDIQRSKEEGRIGAMRSAGYSEEKIMAYMEKQKSESDTTPAIQKKSDEEESGSLMAKSDDGGLNGTTELQAKLDSSKGGGQSLDDKTKSEMESKMGADLSDVKIHTGSNAHEMAEGINAKAFTHGQDIYFKDGNYDTNSSEGKELLAHELTHTQQQKDGVERKVQRQADSLQMEEAKIPFKVDISTYIPVSPDNLNAKESAKFVFAKIFSITVDQEEQYLGYSLSNVDNTTFSGYSADDVKTGEKTIYLKESLYFKALEKIKDLSREDKTISDVSYHIQEAYKLTVPNNISVNPLTSHLRKAYQALALFNSSDVNKLKDQYSSAYNSKIDQSVEKIKSRLSKYTPRAPDRPSLRNDKLLIDGIEFLLQNIPVQPLLLSDKKQSEEDKPRGRIITESGEKIVTVGHESTYTVYVDEEYGTAMQYEWYIFYDPAYPSENKQKIFHRDRGEKVFTYKWESPGLHRIACKVKEMTGDKTSNEDYFASQQYVYASVEEFADSQAAGDLKQQEFNNLRSDLQSFEFQASAMRLDYLTKFLPEFVDTYGPASTAAIVISDKVRDANALYFYNTVYNTEEQRRYEQNLEKQKQDREQQRKANNEAEPEVTQEDIVVGKQNLPVDEVKIKELTSVNDARNAIIKFYNYWYTFSTPPDLTTGVYEDYVQPLDLQGKIRTLGNANTEINGLSLADWVQVMKDYREVMEAFDRYLRDQLKFHQEVNQEQADQFVRYGKMSRNMAEVYENQPNSVTVPAIYYPNEQAMTFDADNAKNMSPLPGNYKAAGYQLYFYMYQKSLDTWDLKEAGSGKEASISARDGEAVLNDDERINKLFKQMSEELSLPKGVLKYNYPKTKADASVAYEVKEVITDGEIPWSTWLIGAGALVGLILITALTLGAASVVTAPLMVLSSGLFIAGNIMHMVEKEEVGALTTEVVLVDSAYIAADLVSSFAAAAKILSIAATESGELAVFAGKAYITLEKYSLIAGRVTLLVASEQILEQFAEVSKIKDPKDREFAMMRLFASLLMMGVLHMVTNKFNWKYEAKWKMRHPNTTGMEEIGKYKYSQATAGEDLSEGDISVKKLTAIMKKDGWDFTKPPPRLVDIGDGDLITLDHRRLVAAKNAGLTEHPIQLIKGETSFPDELRSGYAIKSKVNSDTYKEVENLVGRKINKADPMSRQPQTYKEAVIFRAANQRLISGYKNFPLTGSYNLPEIR